METFTLVKIHLHWKWSFKWCHPIWVEDENGSKIPLNIYGSDLQINGVSVQGQIDANKSNIKNLGSGIVGSTALTAALTALPQTSEELNIVRIGSKAIQ